MSGPRADRVGSTPLGDGLIAAVDGSAGMSLVVDRGEGGVTCERAASRRVAPGLTAVERAHRPLRRAVAIVLRPSGAHAPTSGGEFVS